MPIKVLIADDHSAVLSAMKRILLQESRIKIVGEISSFTATIQAIADFKPEVLLLDLHMPEKLNFTPEFVKSKLTSVPCTLAVSLSNDKEAKALAESYGATALLDKMNLHNEMIPAILSCVESSQL